MILVLFLNYTLDISILEFIGVTITSVWYLDHIALSCVVECRFFRFVG